MTNITNLRALASAISVHGNGWPRAMILLKLTDHPEGIAMGKLAKECGVTSANITGLADALERTGHAERRRAGEDRRLTLLLITEKGRAAVEKATNGGKRP